MSRLDADVVFSPEEIAQVRAVIQRAKLDMDEWRRKSRVTTEQMRQHIGPPGGCWHRWREERRGDK